MTCPALLPVGDDNVFVTQYLEDLYARYSMGGKLGFVFFIEDEIDDVRA
jgi:hypothetical protein